MEIPYQNISYFDENLCYALADTGEICKLVKGEWVSLSKRGDSMESGNGLDSHLDTGNIQTEGEN